MAEMLKRLKALLLRDTATESKTRTALAPEPKPQPPSAFTATLTGTETLPAKEHIDPIRGPKVKFARFVDGKLKLFTAHTGELSYIAVSHVFGKTAWYKIPGIEDEVLASSAKAAFIEKELPKLVGEENFWMDILTVNQRSQADIISVVQAIPRIFRDASRTLAIRENDGFYPCCEEALAEFATYGEFNKKLMGHIQEHQQDLRGEAYLQRLWTLQECMLSQKIQFVVCREGESKLPNADRGAEHFYRNQTDTQRLSDSLWVLSYSFSGPGPESGITDFIRAYIHCSTITRKRPLEPRTAEEDIHTGHFRVNNLGSHRSASMPRDYIFATMPQFPWYHYPSDAENLPFSAIFCDLYDQALHSGHTFTPRITASMTDSEVTSYEESWRPSTKQPEPRTLGDFLKLLGNRLLRPDGLPAGMPQTHLTCEVIAMELGNQQPGTLISFIKESMIFSEQTWRIAHLGGNLSAHGSFPDPEWEVDPRDAARLGFMPDPENPRDPNSLILVHDGDDTILTTAPRYIYEAVDDLDITSIIAAPSWEQNTDYSATGGIVGGYVSVFQQARIILDNMWCAHDDRVRSEDHRGDLEGYLREMRGRWTAPLLHVLTLMAAMVGCDIGLSAVEWVHEHFVPVAVAYGQKLVLGLLARHARMDISAIPAADRKARHEQRNRPQQMISVGQHPKSPHIGKDLVLVKPDGRQAGPVGLVPDFLPSVVNYREGRSDEEYERAIKTLYQDLCHVVGPGQVGFRFVPMRAMFESIRIAKEMEARATQGV